MKRFFLFLIASNFIFSFLVNGQSTANYTRTSNATASLQTMAGSTAIISSSLDDFSSEVISLGFDFWFMGVRFNTFSASSNGAISLGNSAISSTNYGSNFPFASQNIIAPFLQNMETSSTGKVHYTNKGAAPNRTLVVEFLNMGLNNGSSTADATFQVILYETTGAIQFVYGNMAIGSTSGTSAKTTVIGFCSNNVINTVMSVLHATPFATNTTATPTSINYNSTGNIVGLNSAANGSRVQITFTPPVLIAPLFLSFNFTDINTTTLLWTQTAVVGELGFVIFKSDDGGLTYNFVQQTLPNVTLLLINPLLANKNYFFKVFSLSEGGFSTALTGNVSTSSCGGIVANNATISSLGNVNWSALPWSLGHLPTSCENVTIIFDRSTGTSDSSSITLDVDVSVNSLTISNTSTTTADKKQFSFSGDKIMEINGDLILNCPTGNKYSRMQYNVTNKTIINGNLTLGTTTPSATEGYTTIGSTLISPNQTYLIRGNATFNKRALTVDEHSIFMFDGVGAQSLINNTGRAITDTFNDAILFEKLIIGDGRSPVVTFSGSNFATNINDKGRGGVIIGANASIVLPENYSLNGEGTGLYFKMGAGSSVKCGGNLSTDAYGVAGSNFPGGFSSYVLDATSVFEYNGSNAITQTIYNGIPYSKLIITNGTGSGRAQKIAMGPLTINTSTDINALADFTLGTIGSTSCTINTAGPLNVFTTGGLYCNANVISGAGNFTLGNLSYLGVGHSQGISLIGSATGNIQLTGGRTYNNTGNYIYNGIVTQITGTGLSSTCNDITIDNPTSVTIAANQLVNGINLLQQGVFNIGGTKITLNGTGILNSTGGLMKANVGTVEMKGTSGTEQLLAGSWFVGRNISTLINANTKGITIAATLNDTLLISSALLYGNVTNSSITGNDNITLLSRDTATARFGEIVTGSGNTITGKVNIERYLFAKKSWRLLAAPVAIGTSASVTSSWRETGVSTASTGYGTQITGPASFIGMDNYTQRASMKYYNSTINNFVDVTNTNTSAIANNKGYFVFVRGDRNVVVGGTTGATILRIKGDILTGNQTFPVSAMKFESVGNPYPSRIDFRTVSKTNIANSFIVWNPNSAGLYNVGAYETYIFSSPNYVKAGGVIRNFIESGEAVYVQSNVASAGSIIVKESDKGAGSSLQSRPGVNTATLEINLYAKNADSTFYLADGIFINFDSAYNAGFDNDDVRKFMNTYDNLAVVFDNNNLVADRLPYPNATDSIILSLTGTRVGTYRLETDPSVLNLQGLEPVLFDRFLNLQTVISTNTINSISFEITTDPLSKAPNRFVIFFKPVSTLPVTFTEIYAHKNIDKTVDVYWNTAHETDINRYEIETSTTGRDFIKIGTVLPTQETNLLKSYRFLHEKNLVQTTYYRVKAISINGNINISNIVKLSAQPTTEKFTVYPNPVIGKSFKILLNKNVVGKYSVSLFSSNGELITSMVAVVNENDLFINVNLPQKLAAGEYNLKIENKNLSSAISILVK